MASALPDTLLGLDDPGGQALDLSHAHPSGLATLLAGRPTPLSMLFREPAVHSAARRRSRGLRTVAGELASDRGVRAGLLTAGVASWVLPPAPVDGGFADGQAPRLMGPVLLRGCAVRPRGSGHDDYELQLDDTAAVNPELLRRLREDHGVRLDAEALAGLAFGIHGFDPAPVFAVLEDACSGIIGFAVEPRLLVGCFTAGSEAQIGDLEAAVPALAGHPLLGRLLEPPADEPPAVQEHPAPAGGPAAAADLDPQQRAVVDAALAGRSVAVEGPPGTGLTHTLVAAVAGLAGKGRRVLVVTPYRGSADALLAGLDAAGLGDLALMLHDGTGDRGALLAALAGALDAASADAPPPEPDGDPDPAGDAESSLDEAVAAVHEVREPWGVSAYDAMVALAALMATPSPPRTRVRLPQAVCRTLDARTRDALRADLHEVAALGAFTLTPERAPWLDAHVGSEAEAAAALAAARTARESLAAARASMARIAAAAGLVEAASPDGWHRQLDLLVGVRDTLDVLLPSVFEQPLGELIAATATDGGPAGTTWMARRALRRRARLPIRPGVHLPDLHTRLLAAQRQLAGWQARSSGGGWPRVPNGLGVAEQALETLEGALHVLGRTLPDVGPEGLAAQPVELLDDRLAALAGDPDGARDAPRRAALLTRLRDAGLGPLLDDLRSRRAGPDEVDGELDLAWWTSVLEALIRTDQRLARHDGAEIVALGDRVRDAHANAVSAARTQLRRAVAEHARAAVRAHPEQARWLLSEVHRGHRSQWPADLFRQAGDVVAALRPVWVLSPDAVARLLPPPDAGRIVDVVVVDDAGQVGFPEVAAALARGRQVLAAGDRHRLPPATGGPSVLEVVAGLGAVHRLHRDHRTRDGRLLAPLLSRYPGWVATPGAAARSPLELEHVREGTGVPAPGEDVAVSPDAEVARVVDLVTEHAVRRPGESLLVVTLGLRHAARIEETLRAEVAHNVELRRWLDVHWTGGISEPFLVRPVHRVAGVERDAVIVSVGLARTPHGRVLHRFGILDGRHGPACLVTALTRARRRTTLVCAFRRRTSRRADPQRRGAAAARRARDRRRPRRAWRPRPDRRRHPGTRTPWSGTSSAGCARRASPSSAASRRPTARSTSRSRTRPTRPACSWPSTSTGPRTRGWRRPTCGSGSAAPPSSGPAAVPAGRRDGPVLRPRTRGRADHERLARGRRDRGPLGAERGRRAAAADPHPLARRDAGPADRGLRRARASTPLPAGCSDGAPRTADELTAELREALQMARHTERADAGLAAASRRVLGLDTLVP